MGRPQHPGLVFWCQCVLFGQWVCFFWARFWTFSNETHRQGHFSDFFRRFPFSVEVTKINWKRSVWEPWRPTHCIKQQLFYIDTSKMQATATFFANFSQNLSHSKISRSKRLDLWWNVAVARVLCVLDQKTSCGCRTVRVPFQNAGHSNIFR